jgi:hypothetical protein
VLVLISLIFIWIGQWFFPVLPSYFYQTIALLFFGTVGVYFYLLDVKKNRSEYFIQMYIATQFAKILAYGSYMLFIVWDDSNRASDHVIIFMVTYFVFTAIEVIFLYRKVRG